MSEGTVSLRPKVQFAGKHQQVDAKTIKEVERVCGYLLFRGTIKVARPRQEVGTPHTQGVRIKEPPTDAREIEISVQLGGNDTRWTFSILLPRRLTAKVSYDRLCKALERETKLPRLKEVEKVITGEDVKDDDGASEWMPSSAHGFLKQEDNRHLVLLGLFEEAQKNGTGIFSGAECAAVITEAGGLENTSAQAAGPLVRFLLQNQYIERVSNAVSSEKRYRLTEKAEREIGVSTREAPEDSLSSKIALLEAQAGAYLEHEEEMFRVVREIAELEKRLEPLRQRQRELEAFFSAHPEAAKAAEKLEQIRSLLNP